jgi:hypothetical protein
MPQPIVAWAWAWAALAGAALAGCPSLSALECQGAACVDGGGGGGVEAGGARGIACGGGSACAAPQDECCVPSSGPPSCVVALQCSGGTDVFCDDPSQCGGAPCWLCNAGGFQGTSCAYEEDIVKADGCNDPKDVYRLCHSTSQCDAGQVCIALPIVLTGADAGGASWLYACQ